MKKEANQPSHGQPSSQPEAQTSAAPEAPESVTPEASEPQSDLAAELEKLKADYATSQQRLAESIELQQSGAATIQQAAKSVSELREQMEQLKEENEDLKAVPADKQAQAVHDAKKGFKVPKGEQGYTHVVETQVNGEVLEEPQLRAYDPHQYDTLISKQQGYRAEVLHHGKE